MAQTTTATTSGAADGGSPADSQRKRRRRRTVDRFLRPVYPISAIWAGASEEEQRKARTLCGEILGYWLGHESKAALARRLAMPQVRVWQLSQRAMTGMVAALLRPPTGRRGAMPRLDPEVKALRKRVADLESETALLRRLVQLLRTMPGNEDRELPKEAGSAARKRKPRPKVERGGPPAGHGVSADSPPPTR